MKPNLLVVELWGLGDLVIATPFLQAACERYSVTLLAKPYAFDLQQRFWPEVEVIPFVAPWTAFRHKYRLLQWPWRKMFALRPLARRRFAVGLSGRWDPRDHILLWLFRARRRIGFPRLNSQLFLTDSVARPDALAHRYENWRLLANALEIPLPPAEKIVVPPRPPRQGVLIHTGAGQPVRVWPLERYRQLATHLRAGGFVVHIACDPDQHDWWLSAGESGAVCPHNVSELLRLIDSVGAFVGNDSGPSHLAARCGVPTFTIFGPQLPEWFAPIHPQSEYLEGKACPFKPCSDYCRFESPLCIWNIGEEEVARRVSEFLLKVTPAGNGQRQAGGLVSA